MALIVQKYGGTSVGSAERIKAVADRVAKTASSGNRVVVVVSAMGKTTDSLVKLAREVSTNPSRREMDMLLATGEQVTIAVLTMALQELGQPAISLTGAQVGIVTEAEHSRARILEIKPDRVTRHLDEGKVVVVAGFQGVSASSELEITTLGRGGSDTSAVALAAGLGADACEIYTDVPGILTTDPRVVPEAQLMGEITANEMLELASLGAKVLHPRAVEIARNYGVPLVVRSSWSEEPGTWVLSPATQSRSLAGLEISRPVDGVEFTTNVAKVGLMRVPDRPGIAAQLFGAISAQGIDVDLIVQSIHEGNTNDIAFTIDADDINRVEAVSEAISPILGNNREDIAIAGQMAKVCICGAGIVGRPGIAAQMFRTLADAGVNIEMISTSEVKLSCAIAAKDGDRAIAALCKEFDILSSPSPSAGTSPTQKPAVRGVALDRDRARLAILNVPDRPGMAAELFGLLAGKNICVDTIVQSQRTRSVNGMIVRDIACMLSAADALDAKQILELFAPQLGCGDVTIDESVAKVSIVGAGMIGHPGIAAQMFQALADTGINILMISTSDIKVSCTIESDRALEALQVVHTAFNLGGDARVKIGA
jgi:aspartate kinase